MARKGKYDRKKRAIIISGLIAVVILTLYRITDTGRSSKETSETLAAAELMSESVALISGYCLKNNININGEADPAFTGLIGPEISDITTTVGHLESKRTSLNPEFASLIVRLLSDAGVVADDTIAIASSGSFPALMIASMSAAEAMGVKVRMILSVGSSSYGANNPEFMLPDIYGLVKDKYPGTQLVGLSLGGEADEGKEFEAYIRESIIKKISGTNLTLIYNNDLATNISQRIDLFTNFSTIDIKALISCGGSWSSMGTSALSLKLKPGLIRTSKLPPEEYRGLIYTMLGHDIPVIHLLYIKGICQRYGILYDPVMEPIVSR